MDKDLVITTRETERRSLFHVKKKPFFLEFI